MIPICFALQIKWFTNALQVGLNQFKEQNGTAEDGKTQALQSLWICCQNLDFFRPVAALVRVFERKQKSWRLLLLLAVAAVRASFLSFRHLRWTTENINKHFLPRLGLENKHGGFLFLLPVGLRSSTVKLMQCTESQFHPAQRLRSALLCPAQARSQKEQGVGLSANLRHAGLCVGICF